MSSSARQQARRENALRRLVQHVPPEVLRDWSRDDIMGELRAREPTLFRAVVGPAELRFLRLQRVLPLPERKDTRVPDDAPRQSTMPLSAAYVEALDKAATDMANRHEYPKLVGSTRLEMIDKHELELCTAYQRDVVNEHRVDQIANALDLRAFGSLLVAKRDGKYWVVDGQHRRLAALKRDDITRLSCVVFDSRSIADEANLFALLNMSRVAVSATDKFRALVAGDDPVAVALHESLAAIGVHVAKNANSANQLASIAYVYGMAKRNFERTEAILCTVQTLCDEQPMHGDIIKALDYLDSRIEGGVTQDRLLARLRRIGVGRLMDTIRKARSTRGGREQIALRVLGEINSGLAEPKRFLLKDLP